MDWRNRIYSSIGYGLQCARKDLQDGELIYRVYTGHYIRCKPDSELLEFIKLFMDVKEEYRKPTSAGRQFTKNCTSCDEAISDEEYKDFEEKCQECYFEIHKGRMPHVTSSNLKPSGTGLTYRQRCKKGKTDG